LHIGLNIAFAQKANSSDKGKKIANWAEFKECFASSPYKQHLETEQAAFNWAYDQGSAAAPITIVSKDELAAAAHPRVYSRVEVLMAGSEEVVDEDILAIEDIEDNKPLLVVDNFIPIEELTAKVQDRRIVLLKADVTALDRAAMLAAVLMASGLKKGASIAGGVIDMPYCYGQLDEYMATQARSDNPYNTWCANRFDIECFKLMWTGLTNIFGGDAMSKSKWILFGGTQQVYCSLKKIGLP
jgi:hypothetical protein